MTAFRFDVNDPDLRERFLSDVLMDALAGLQADSRPSWGKMTAQQMVEHLTWAFELSTGQSETECPIPEAQRERLRTFLYDNRATPHEYMNPVLAAGLPPLRHRGLDAARGALWVEVNRFLLQLRAGPGALHTHPVFGPIGPTTGNAPISSMSSTIWSSSAWSARPANR